jgi:hypothetical protein
MCNDFHDPDHLGQCRLAALRRFLADFEAGRAEGGYVTAALPDLPFEDGQFDLALVGNGRMKCRAKRQVP